jgi:hypothetical protein
MELYSFIAPSAVILSQNYERGGASLVAKRGGASLVAKRGGVSLIAPSAEELHSLRRARRSFTHFKERRVSSLIASSAAELYSI